MSMRLNKMSKEVGMTPAEIVKVLKKERKLAIENSPNYKLDEESVKWLLDTYKKEEAETVIEKQPEPEVSSVTEKIIAKAQAKKEEKTVQVESITNEDVLVADGKIEAEVPELTGPKIIGKIDLPAPKVKDEKVENEQSEDSTENIVKREIRKPRKPRTAVNRKQDKRKPVVILTEQEKREKEIEKALKQREKAKKALKEKKKKAYLEKASPVIEKTKIKQSKKKTEIRKQQQVEAKKISPKKEAPKGIFSKMWHWLNNAD